MAQVFWTVFSGVVIYVFGQIILKWFIDPAQDAKRTIAQIAHVLVQHRSTIANSEVFSENQRGELSAELQGLSARLFSTQRLVPWYRVTRFAFGLPPKKNIEVALTQLFGLSNAILSTKGNLYEEKAMRRNIILSKLKIEIPQDETQG